MRSESDGPPDSRRTGGWQRVGLGAGFCLDLGDEEHPGGLGRPGRLSVVWVVAIQPEDGDTPPGYRVGVRTHR